MSPVVRGHKCEGSTRKVIILRAVAAVLLLALLTGCATAAPAAIPLSGRLVAVIAEEHLGPAFAASAPESEVGVSLVEPVGATLHFRASGTHRQWRASVTYGTAPHAGLEDCAAPSGALHGASCFRHAGTRVAWFSSGGPLYVTSSRGDTSVNIVATNLDWSGDPRNGVEQVTLDQLVALAEDPRLDATTDGALQAVGRAYERWTVDPGCIRSAAGGVPIPLSQKSGVATEPITPQAIAAVLASHVGASCAGDLVGARAGSIGAMAYLPNSAGWVSAWLTRDPVEATCPAWSACWLSEGGVTTFTRTERTEPYPARTRLVRDVDGGYLIVEVATRRRVTADGALLQLTAVQDIATDDRLAFNVDPELNAAGDQLALCWRLYGPTEG